MYTHININEDTHKHTYTDVENSIFGRFPVETVWTFVDNIKFIYKMKQRVVNYTANLINTENQI